MLGKIEKFLFWFFLIAYASLFFIDPQLWIADDHMLLDTIQFGKHFSIIFPRNGRFEPLNAQEYYIISKLLAAKPILYWGFNAFQFILLGVIFYRILKKITSNKIFIYVPLLFLLFSPGLILAWSRFFVGERGASFCLTVFIYCYFIYLEQPKNNLIWGGIALIFANFAQYYKEPVFISLGSFSILHLILSWRDSTWRVKALDTLLLLSSTLFASLYFFMIYLNISVSYDDTNRVFYLDSNPLFKYARFDPVLLFYLLPFTLWRSYQILIKKQPVYAVYDSLLIAATVYVAIYFKLNIYSQYYLLPAYIFAIPALLFFVTRHRKRFLVLQKWGAIAIMFFLITISLPKSLSILVQRKYEATNFNHTLNFLAKNINSKSLHQRPSIFLYGINRSTGLEFYYSFGKFLQYKGLTNQQFDLKSDLPVDDALLFAVEGKNVHSPYSVFQNNKISKISKGDYLVLTPYSPNQPFTPSYLNSLKQDYDLLFQTSRDFNWSNYINNYSLTAIIKRKLFNVQNYSYYSDYYVFLRK